MPSSIGQRAQSTCVSRKSKLFVSGLAGLLACLLCLRLPAAQAESGLIGTWQEPTGSLIEVVACGSALCLRIVKISPQAPTRVDVHNPDPKLRGRSLCSLQIGSGFHQEKDDTAEGGTLYDPKTGKTYKGSMTRVGDQLRLRGYIGIPLLGATQTWVRTGHATPCRS